MEWLTLEGDPNNQCRFLQDNSSYCTYARIRVKGGHEKSEANQLISNLKMSSEVKTSKPARWRYKLKAIQQFASELKSLLGGALDQNVPICFLPTSKKEGDPEFDPRWKMLEKSLLKLDSRFRIEKPFEVIDSTEAYHSSGESRNPRTIQNNLKWLGFPQNDFKEIILIDDVLTTGAHFIAARNLICENHSIKPQKISGVFWAKHQHPVIDLSKEFDDLSQLLEGE